MADQKAVVTLKDGTKIVLDNEADIQKYSDRDDLDSISFFGGDDAADAGVQEQADAGVVAVVEQPKTDPVVAKPQPVADHATAITATIGALAGAVSSAGTPALMNLAKSFIKGKLKLNAKGGGEQTRPEDQKEEPTDCKTHQIKAGAKFASISARITALENRPVQSTNDDDELDFDSSDVDELKEKVKRLEKMVKEIKAKGRKK